MAVLPVTVLTGFLGAGKTTLLGRLLSRGAGGRVGLLVNELGQAGIERAPGRTTYLELAEGCVCCVRNPELIAALRDLHGRGDLDRVVVETTGLADPLALTWTLARPELRGVARLDAVVAVVDPVNFERTRCEEWEAQIRCADLVVLSKVDLADAAVRERARAAVRELRPAARILDGDHGLPAAVVFGIEEGAEPAASGRAADPAPGASGPAPHGRHSDFRVATVADTAVYRLEPLEDLLEALPERIFRAKGIVHLADGRWATFQAVGGRLQLTFGDGAPAHGESRVVAFGRGLSREDLASLLAPCRAR